jgi:rhodanese-related sulfurtransferase
MLIQLGKIPKDKTIYVHCKTGMRARLGSSILAKNGFEPHVLPVKFEDFAQAGLPVVKG